MSAVGALNSHFGGTNGSSARVSYDARHHNQLAYQVALEISQHLRELITLNLNLEMGNLVSILKIEIVSLIDLLNGFFELKNLFEYCLRSARSH